MPTGLEKSMSEAVIRGAAFLDRVRPGWEDEIDLDLFDMGHGFPSDSEGKCGCVGAQLCGNYTEFKTEYGVDSSSSAVMGFDLTEDCDWPFAWYDLTNLWKAEIRRRYT